MDFSKCYLLSFLVLFSLLDEIIAVSSSSSYIAAVAEHQTYVGFTNDSAKTLLNINLDLYERHISLASQNGAQIIVFPEFGLTAVQGTDYTRADLYPFATSIPEGNDKITPCIDINYQTSSFDILYRMSCAARNHKIMVLVNTIDWVICSNADEIGGCPSDGHYQYNTDILFDETGMVVTKYHKSHEWPAFIGPYDQSPSPTRITYMSSFGVEFGLFICYDIMFNDPAKVLREEGIVHFLYAVEQYNIGLATTMTEWSKTEKATLLASNLGAGKKGDCSGVLVNGALLPTKKYYLGADYPDENILIAEVPLSLGV